jgi:hypothetical protein
MDLRRRFDEAPSPTVSTTAESARLLRWRACLCQRFFLLPSFLQRLVDAEAGGLLRIQ